MLNNKNIANLITELGIGGKVKMEYSREITECLTERLIIEIDKVWLSISKNTDGDNIWWTSAIKITKITIDDIVECNNLVGSDRFDEFECDRRYKIIGDKLMCRLTMSKYENDLDDIFAEPVEQFESSYEVDNVSGIVNTINRNLSNIKFDK